MTILYVIAGRYVHAKDLVMAWRATGRRVVYVHMEVDMRGAQGEIMVLDTATWRHDYAELMDRVRLHEDRGDLTTVPVAMPPGVDRG